MKCFLIVVGCFSAFLAVFFMAAARLCRHLDELEARKDGWDL